MKPKKGVIFLGFLWADGHINKKSSRVSLDLVRDDADYLYKQCLVISNDFNMKMKPEYIRNDSLTVRRKPQNIIYLTNNKLSLFLKNHDYMNKSNVSADSILEIVKYKNFWFRGYFDGDGSLLIRERNKIFNSSLQFSSSIEQDWKFLLNFVKSLNLKSFKIIRRIEKSGNSSMFKSESIYESKIFLDYVYSDYLNIGLHRKYLIYLQLKEITLKRKSKYENICRGF